MAFPSSPVNLPKTSSANDKSGRKGVGYISSHRSALAKQVEARRKSGESVHISLSLAPSNSFL